MTSFNFTKASIIELLPQKAQYQVRDTKVNALCLRVSPGNTKLFVLYRKIDGKPVRISIGRFPETSIENARKQALLLQSQLIDGSLSLPTKRPKEHKLSFMELFERYYNEHLLIFTKRPNDNRAQVRYYLQSRIGTLIAADITREQMKQVHLEVFESSGKGQANRVLNLASAIFNFGINEGIHTGRNPCVGIKRFKSKTRDRFLSKDELARFFDGLAREDQIYQDFFMLSLFIGARKTTMLKMQYSEIDLNLKRWRLSEEQSKNGDVNIYMLPDVAIEIIQRRKTQNAHSTQPSSYVFPGAGIVGHLVDPKKAFGRVKRFAGLENFRIHDLRRTLGSYMAINNCSLPIIGQALNHKSQDSTAIYARLSKDPVLEAVNLAANTMKDGVASFKIWDR